MPIKTTDAPGLVPGAVTGGSGRMAKVKMLRNSVASGVDVMEGKVYELSEEDARTLIQMGKAIPSPKGKVENREADKETKKSTRAKK